MHYEDEWREWKGRERDGEKFEWIRATTTANVQHSWANIVRKHLSVGRLLNPHTYTHTRIHFIWANLFCALILRLLFLLLFLVLNYYGFSFFRHSHIECNDNEAGESNKKPNISTALNSEHWKIIDERIHIHSEWVQNRRMNIENRMQEN